MEFAISQPKMVLLPRDEKANTLIELYASNGSIRFTLAMALTLKFSRANMEFGKSQPNVVRLQRNEKQTYRLNSKPHMWPMGLKLDLWIFKVKCYLDLWQNTWPWPWIFVVKFWNSCISERERQLTLSKGGGSRSFLTMTLTIWWPRSVVRIYQI